MEGAPVTIATGALGPVVAKLKAMLRRRGEYRLRRRTRKDVKLIRSELKSIHSILWAIWEREDPDAAGKQLRMEAWRLADDMNDAIDDFILGLNMKGSNDGDGRRFVQDKTQPSPFEDLKRRAAHVSERCRNKWKMETTPKTTISSLFSRTKSTVDDSGSANRRPRLVDPYVHRDISEIMEMEEPRDKLIKHLVGEEESTPHLKMASILGAAGTGKTTLARLVYEGIKDKFQARAFVSVISNHNITDVLASILQQVAPESIVLPLAGTKPATEKHLVDSISNFLKNKRYMVIIDDIWHRGEWETIWKSLPDNNLGSGIVTTSRVNSMAEIWRDDFDALVYQINYLCDDNVRKMVGMKTDMVGEGFYYGHLSHHNVRFCGGMPLALVCMISAMAKERARQEQQGLCARARDVQYRIEEQLKRNGIKNTEGFEPLVESLELGYNDLPHQMLKTCLLYCSIYPEYHRFTTDDLVRRWIAQGFVHKEELAKDYLDELVSRGLIIDRLYSQSLHPVMRSYLRCKLREENFITCTSDGIQSTPIGRLCIDSWPAPAAASSDPLEGIDWHHIRSLVVLERADKVPYKSLQHLQVLDVKGKLENQHVNDMCGLLRLRHLLGLHGEGITEIPTEITRLQYLETFEVCSTEIGRIPAEIGDLKQLKTLDVSDNRGLTELPMEMGNLKNLETLCFRDTNVREQQLWNIIGELQQLKNLDVSGNKGVTVLPKEIGQLQHLETLYLAVTGITELPPEIGNLQRLKVLYLNYTGITKLPRDIGKLQHLETLDLYACEVRKVPREIGGLQKLKNLNTTVGILPFEAGQLSKVTGLPKCIHKAWKNSDLASSLAREILSFQKIDEDWGGDGGLVMGTKHMHIPYWIKEHFNNIGSLDIRICKLEEQDIKILREMPSLLVLKLRFEAVPIKPIAISGGGFVKLRALCVDSRVPLVTFQEEAMQSLQWLVFEFQFYGGPPNTRPVGINHLVSLQVVSFKCKEWYRGDSPCISATIDVVRKEAREHPNKIELNVSGQGKEIFPENHIAQSSEDGNDPCSSIGANEIEKAQA